MENNANLTEISMVTRPLDNVKELNRKYSKEQAIVSMEDNVRRHRVRMRKVEAI